jgi:hypothetical protein
MFSLIQPITTHDVVIDDISAGEYLCENWGVAVCRPLIAVELSENETATDFRSARQFLSKSGFVLQLLHHVSLLSFISAGRPVM